MSRGQISGLQKLNIEELSGITGGMIIISEEAFSKKKWYWIYNDATGELICDTFSWKEALEINKRINFKECI